MPLFAQKYDHHTVQRHWYVYVRMCLRYLKVWGNRSKRGRERLVSAFKLILPTTSDPAMPPRRQLKGRGG